MLSLARNDAAGRCIHCAIRSQRLNLQQIRLRTASSSSSRRSKRDSDSLDSRFAGGQRVSGASLKDKRMRKAFNPRGNGKIKGDYTEILKARLKALEPELRDSPIVEHYTKEQREDGRKVKGFNALWQSFLKDLDSKPAAKPFFGADNPAEKEPAQVAADLKQTWVKSGQRGLDARIKYAFYAQVTGERFTESDVNNQRGLADLRYPTEWFPATRTMHRTVHLHVGPTNSGKTYHALQRLEQAEAGVYAGPLRLLAHEVYTRMKAKGKNCALVTGEERRLPDVDGEQQSFLTSCTVEMVPLNTPLDIAVIDEIQMIGNAERGWAWTQALLGVRAKEVHLCGEDRTVPLIKELCAYIGDKLEIHRYKRLSPLKIADESLNGKMGDLRKGDCVVSFSVMGIHALRRQIERATGRKVATVYGSLPPETRAQQARLFNDPDNDYDFLVASDAVGMGLNLAIKRIIFESSSKFDGAARRALPIADIKQIAGRAGRYRTAAQATEQTAASQSLSAAKGEDPSKVEVPDNVGLVTTLEKFDFPVVRAAMATEPEPIRTAGIFPPSSVLERFSSYFPPATPFSYIMTRLHELSLMHKRFHLCGLKDQIWVADLIEPVQGLTISDRNMICAAPAGQGDADLWKDLMPAYARVIAEQTGGSLVDIPQLPLEVLDADVEPSREYLRELERLHKGIVTYLWLSYRFAGLFTTRALAFHVKTMVEEKIEQVLGQFSFTEAQRRKIAAKREKDLLKDMENIKLGAKGSPTVDANTGEDVRVASEESDDLAENGDEEYYGSRAFDEPDRDSLFEQTTLTSGGDRFSGEDEFGFGEPDQLDAEIEAEQELEPQKQEAASSSFAIWRARQTKGESQGSVEPEDLSLGTAHEEGEQAGRSAVHGNTLKQLGESEPTVADAEPAIPIAEKTSRSSKATSPEQDPLDLGTYSILDVDLPDGQRPASTQEVSPDATAQDEGAQDRQSKD